MRSTLALGAILTALLAGLALGDQEPSTGAHGAFYEDVALDTSQVERGGDPVPVSATREGGYLTEIFVSVNGSATAYVWDCADECKLIYQTTAGGK